MLYLFIFEFLVKIACMGWGYFKDGWNNFDFIVLMISIITTFFSGIINLGSQATIIRVFKLGRVLKLINRAQSLRMIFNTFLITLPSLGTIGLLLCLTLIIYAILGLQKFSYLKHWESINENTNFETFVLSLVTLSRVSTGEGWNFVMDDMSRTNQPNFRCETVDNYDIYVEKG